MRKRLVVLGGLAALAWGGTRVLERYRRWQRDAYAELEEGSRIVQTARGPMEIDVRGEGPAVLVLHGIGGGYDHNRRVAQILCAAGFQCILVSRPGYLRTPLSTGETPELQAEAYAALLDALGIARVGVIGMSAAGPSALQFARHYPERCWALVTVAAITRRLERSHSRAEMAVMALLARDPSLWLLSRSARRWPAVLLRAVLPDESQRAGVRADPDKMAMAYELLDRRARGALRRGGFANDLARAMALPVEPWSDLRVPVLVLHGTADTIVPFEHGRFAAGTIPNAQFVAVEGGTHMFGMTHKELVWPRAAAFLREHLPEP